MDLGKKTSSYRRYPASEYSDRVMGLNRIEDRNLEIRLKIIDNQSRYSVNMINHEIKKIETELNARRELLKKLNYLKGIEYLNANIESAFNQDLDQLNIIDNQIEKLGVKTKNYSTSNLSRIDHNDKNYLFNPRHSSGSNRSTLDISAVPRAYSALPNLYQINQKQSFKLSNQNTISKSSSKTSIEKRIEQFKEINSLISFDKSKSSSLNDLSSAHSSLIKLDTSGVNIDEETQNTKRDSTLNENLKINVLSCSPIVVSESKLKKLAKKQSKEVTPWSINYESKMKSSVTPQVFTPGFAINV